MRVQASLEGRPHDISVLPCLLTPAWRQDGLGNGFSHGLSLRDPMNCVHLVRIHMLIAARSAYCGGEKLLMRHPFSWHAGLHGGLFCDSLRPSQSKQAKDA